MPDRDLDSRTFGLSSGDLGFFQTPKIGTDSEVFRLLMSEDGGLDSNGIFPQKEPVRKPQQNRPGSRLARDRRKRERQNRRRGRK